jgi:hypothetical protein
MKTDTVARLDRNSDGSLKAQHFADIPFEFQTHEIANEWFLQKQHKNTEPLADCFRQIPQHLRSIELVRWAADDGINAIEGLDAQHPEYQELAQICVLKNYQHIVSVHPDVRQALLPVFCAIHITKIHQVDKEFEWFRSALTPECLRICTQNIDFFLDTPEEQITTDISQYTMTQNFCVWLAYGLRKRGKIHLLAERIAAGDWPKDNYVKNIEKPISLLNGRYKLTASESGKEHETLYMAYLMSYPMDEVVPLMKGRRLQKLLFEMYSTEALAPYLKKSRELRGILLEDSLGL